MHSVYLGDFLYFKSGGKELLGEVIGINTDKVISVRFQDEDGKIKVQPIGAIYNVTLSDIVGIKRLDCGHGGKEKHADFGDDGRWDFTS